MRHVPVRLAVLLILGVCLSAEHAFAQDDGAGTIAGWQRFVAPLMEGGDEVGEVYFPAQFDGDRPVRVVSPQRFEVRRTSADDPGEELIHLAGEPFVPPRGRWRVWLQGEWSMTPFTVLQVAPSSHRWRRLIPRFLPVAPAGRIGVEPATLAALAVDSEPELWLLSSASDLLGGRSELSRRRSLPDVGEGVLMPAATTLAGLWDERLKRYLALSRPFTVEAETTTPAPLARPAADKSWLLAYVEIPGAPLPGRSQGIELTLSQEGEPSHPDFTVRTVWGLYAVWYGLRPGAATLAGGSGELYLEPRNLELDGGDVASVRADLAERPSLEVSLTLPTLLRKEAIALQVRKLPGGEVQSCAACGSQSW